MTKKKNRRLLGAVLTIAAVAVLIATWQAPLIAQISGIAPSPGSPNDDSSSSSDENDFALFTSRTDDKVTCTGVPEPDEPDEGAFVIHISVTNFDADERRLNIIFTDADFVTYKVPEGTSFHLTQVAGTGPFDSTIIIDPLDNDGDVNPMVGWVSVEEAETGDLESLTCDVTPLV